MFKQLQNHIDHHFQAGFSDWLADNLHVWQLFEARAMQLAAAGRTRVGARMIAESMRWDTAVRELPEGKYKLNDHWTPDLARLFTRVHPQYASLFQFRERRAA